MIPHARQVLRQTRARIRQGVTNSKGKLVSIFEPHAQILRRGKLHKPTEFGMMAKVQEAEGGDHEQPRRRGRNNPLRSIAGGAARKTESAAGGGKPQLRSGHSAPRCS